MIQNIFRSKRIISNNKAYVNLRFATQEQINGTYKNNANWLYLDDFNK